MIIGYGWKTPVTAGGKFLTCVIIVTLLPFYVHCLATLAGKINRFDLGYIYQKANQLDKKPSLCVDAILFVELGQLMMRVLSFRKLDGIFAYSEFVDDEDDMCIENTKQLSKAKHLIVLKG